MLGSLSSSWKLRLIAGFGLILLSLSSVSTVYLATDQKSKEVHLEQCSRSELEALQKHWQWLMEQTTVSEKVMLYRSFMDEVTRLLAKKVGQKYAASYAKLFDRGVPIELAAYRLFSFYGLYINAFTSPDVLASTIEHYFINQPSVLKSFFAGSFEMINALTTVLGKALYHYEEKITFNVCMTEIAKQFQSLLEKFRFHASCDVIPTSTDAQDLNITGYINFTQGARGGPTTVEVGLTGFQSTNFEHFMHIHEANKVSCVEASFNYEPHGTNQRKYFASSGHVVELRALDDGRVQTTLRNNLIALFGFNNVVGRTISIYSATGGVLGQRRRLACCTINQTYQ